MNEITETLEKEIWNILDIIKKRDPCEWDSVHDLECFFDKINWLYILKHINLSEEMLEFIIKKKEEEYGGKSTYYLRFFCENEQVSFRFKLKMLKKYNILEQETKSHFIEYSKIKNRTKDLIDFIETI